MVACKETFHLLSPHPPPPPKKNKDDWNPNPQIPLRTKIHFLWAPLKFLSEGSKFCRLLGTKK